MLELVSLLEIVTSSSVIFRRLGGLKMFGEKTPGKCKIYIGIAITADSVVLFFIFTRFNTTPLILLVKTNPNSELQVS